MEPVLESGPQKLRTCGEGHHRQRGSPHVEDGVADGNLARQGASRVGGRQPLVLGNQ
jgi:hypothetical protein